MTAWATCFPVPNHQCAKSLFSIFSRTLSESPIHPWELNDFLPGPINGTVSMAKANQVVEFAHFEREGQLWTGARHIHPSEADGEVWETVVVCYSSKIGSHVSIKLERTSVLAKKLNHDPKVPYVVRNILAEHSGGLDGSFAVQRSPHPLGESDVLLAARIIRGEASTSLPIVYLSSGYDHAPIVHADKLSAWLGGMAHVVVEPSRHFSRALAREVSFTNPHSGAVGVFWPYGAGKAIRCLPENFSSPVEMATHVTHIVRDALVVVRQPPEVSWGAIIGEISRANIEKLQLGDTLQAQELVKQFDNEVKALQAKADSAEREVERLRRELQRASAQAASAHDGVLKVGNEQPLYMGELQYSIIYALQRSLSHLSPKGRAYDVVQSIIEGNPPPADFVALETALDQAIPESGKLEGHHKKALEKLGFIITEEGKHIKLVFQDDERYTFAAAKTPSDHRAMKNFKALLIRQMCK
ncbi:hypothetical protein [Prosthecobacter sp.]|uniref:hypothetical protein n=1 Tax=Prosthecobacter sp. TaxID=1965333 RepID=UPI001D4D74AC|nr:hypothetical protein [Prosthecobacter sp.]MCB1276360.1 hypothetical protein [Prosthecobacter sp.]